MFDRDCYTSTHVANFSVCHAYYEFSVVRLSVPPDKSKIPEFIIKLNEILSSTSQSDHVFIVGDLNINLVDPTAIENDCINNTTQTPSSL